MRIQPVNLIGKKEIFGGRNKNIENSSRVISTSPINNISFRGIEKDFEYNFSMEELKDRLNPQKYTKWDLLAPDSNVYKNLAEGDKKALEHLIRAAEYFDNVYKRLDNIHNLEFEKFLTKEIAKGDGQAILTKKLYDGQKGIIGKSVDGKEVNLVKNIKNFAGRGFFPEDLSEEEFHKILIKMIKDGKIGEVKSILNQRSVVERNGNELRSIDYTEFFKNEFSAAAKELELAAGISTNKDFNEFLILQSKALKENNPLLDCAADKKWATLQDTPLEFTIGRESYSDKMTPTVFKNSELKDLLEKYKIPVYAKDNIGVRVGIVDRKGTEYLLKIKEFLPYMADNMPYKYLYNSKNIEGKSSHQTMVDAHIVHMTGHNSAYRGSISIASNLPNPDKLAIQTGGGFRNVYNKELRDAKYADGIEKKLDAILDKSQQEYFSTEALHDFTILHENLHSLGPKEGLSSLGVYKNTIEELKADMGALTMLEKLKHKGFYTLQKQKEIITSLIVAYVPLGPDFNDAHRARNIMQHNYFIKNGGVKIDESGKMKIDFEKVTKCAEEMLKDAIKIQLSKNENRAKEYFEKYAVWTKDLNKLADNLKNVDKRLNSYLYSPFAKLVLKKIK